MKFIRDIIVEKANTADVTDNLINNPSTVDAEAQGLALDQEGHLLDPNDRDVDIVHKMASGGRSLVGSDNYARGIVDTASDSVDFEDRDDLALSDYDDSEVDDEDDFSFFGEPGDYETESLADVWGGDSAQELGSPDSSGGDRHAELFADLWPEKGQVEVPDDTFAEVAGTPEFYEDHPEPVSGAAEPSSDLSAPIPPPQAPSQDTTLHQAMCEDPFARPLPTGDAVQQVGQDDDQIARADETSSFQRIIKRRDHAALDLPPHSVQSVAETPLAPPQAPSQAFEVPAPAAGRAARRAGRVKTRLLGFNAAQDADTDPFSSGASQQPENRTMYPVGWMVVVAGPGCGNAFTLFSGVSQIGRGEDQAIRLDFGDNSISRSNHALIAYDGEQRAFYLGHGGKANLVRLDGKPVLSTEELCSGGLIRIGETTLRFVALCGTEFDWDRCQDANTENASFV